ESSCSEETASVCSSSSSSSIFSSRSSSIISDCADMVWSTTTLPSAISVVSTESGPWYSTPSTSTSSLAFISGHGLTQSGSANQPPAMDLDQLQQRLQCPPTS